MGDVNGTTTGNGIYWPGFPDPVVTDPQPLSKVVIRLLHVLQVHTRKFVEQCIFNKCECLKPESVYNQDSIQLKLAIHVSDNYHFNTISDVS